MWNISIENPLRLNSFVCGYNDTNDRIESSLGVGIDLWRYVFVCDKENNLDEMVRMIIDQFLKETSNSVRIVTVWSANSPTMNPARHRAKIFSLGKRGWSILDLLNCYYSGVKILQNTEDGDIQEISNKTALIVFERGSPANDVQNFLDAGISMPRCGYCLPSPQRLNFLKSCDGAVLYCIRNDMTKLHAIVVISVANLPWVSRILPSSDLNEIYYNESAEKAWGMR